MVFKRKAKRNKSDCFRSKLLFAHKQLNWEAENGAELVEMTKRKRIGGRASSSGAKTQDNSAEGTEGREKKRRKRSTSPNTDPVSIDT